MYAELYEMSKEDVAEQQVKTKDWDETAKELDKIFFTILENDGYSPKDLQEAEMMSAKTGRKVVESGCFI